ncbi:MAG: proline iminopeptidase-family hydrolase [Ferruginibacter sp.]
MRKIILGCLILTVMISSSCRQPVATSADHASYFAPLDSGIQDGGINIIEVPSAKGPLHIWTKRIGNNPKIKLLLLSGGPGATHEYFECMESFLPAEGIEFIYYDQSGTGFSDNPADTSFWNLDRYVEEVEHVRLALGLNKDNFYLLGHSWGGILAMQYALKYQANMKGLIISNMMSSCPAYGRYADSVLAQQMSPVILDSIKSMEANNDFNNPRYMGLLMENFYTQHILRLPLDKWPDPVNRAFAKMNKSLYVTMQGPSEFGIAGKLANWDVSQRLPEITVPTLTIGGAFDTMDPEHMKWMSTQVKNGRFLLCPKGSHMSFYDDQQTYMTGLVQFLKNGNNK